ncbi:MAG TPA: hypothetical protein VN914_12030, partial [Polyangia bacterium]|nr:hypothetical protein [Polyangia bacterium]
GPQLGLFADKAPPRRDDPISPTLPTLAALREVAEALKRVDPDELSPRAAWDLVAELRKKLTIPS